MVARLALLHLLFVTSAAAILFRFACAITAGSQKLMEM